MGRLAGVTRDNLGQPVHHVVRLDAFGFGVATLFSYYILKPSLGAAVNRPAVSVLLVLVGMGLGALNEIIEFIAVLTVPETGVGGYENTMWDMIFNTIGAVLVVIYINLRRAGSVFRSG